MPSMRESLKESPLGPPLRWVARKWRAMNFGSSGLYWESRYQKGGTSGAGSYGRLAEFKAEVINGLVDELEIASVIEFGCGDGNQLTLASYPIYTGFDVSKTAVDHCRAKFRGRDELTFLELGKFHDHKADLSVSLDVIYHLIEDETFTDYMRRLFNSANRHVLIYSSNFENARLDTFHIRHRVFSNWIDLNRPDWKLLRHIPNRYPFKEDDPDTSFADFYLYGCS